MGSIGYKNEKKCPVCGSDKINLGRCMNCFFSDFRSEFISKEELTLWKKESVYAHLKAWRRSHTVCGKFQDVICYHKLRLYMLPRCEANNELIYGYYNDTYLVKKFFRERHFTYWFIENVLEEVPKCGKRYFVQSYHLEILLAICKIVKHEAIEYIGKDHRGENIYEVHIYKAADILPPFNDAFFDNKHYRNMYANSVVEMIGMLSHLLKTTDFDREAIVIRLE